MLRLQCLLCLDGEEEMSSMQVMAIEVSPDDRMGELQTRLAVELQESAVEGAPSNPATTLKLYVVQHQRLTYRQDPVNQHEVLFFDGVEISRPDVRDGAFLRGALQLVPWALVSWYFQDQQFAFPDAIDVVFTRGNEEAKLE